jgi:hypothetical protein
MEKRVFFMEIVETAENVAKKVTDLYKSFSETWSGLKEQGIDLDQHMVSSLRDFWYIEIFLSDLCYANKGTFDNLTQAYNRIIELESHLYLMMHMKYITAMDYSNVVNESNRLREYVTTALLELFPGLTKLYFTSGRFESVILPY